MLKIYRCLKFLFDLAASNIQASNFWSDISFYGIIT